MPLYEIEKGIRPPRTQVRAHYAMTRRLVEEKIPAISNLPKVEQMLPVLPSSIPTLPREVWTYIRYPYNLVTQSVQPAAPRGPGQAVEGIIVGRLLERRGWEPAPSAPAGRVRTV